MMYFLRDVFSTFFLCNFNQINILKSVFTLGLMQLEMFGYLFGTMCSSSLSCRRTVCEYCMLVYLSVSLSVCLRLPLGE